MARSAEYNILVAGVGGQGVVLLSELLGDAAVAEGRPVRGSEVLGMAVRGGRVTSSIRVGEHAHGPLIPSGRVDLLVALEPAEALLHCSMLAPSAWAVVNTRPLVPFTVSLGHSRYPALEQVLARLRQGAERVLALDADALGEQAGAPRAANVVMLGAACGTGRLPIGQAALEQAIARRFAGPAREVNQQAFRLGLGQTDRRARPAAGPP
jgi:indolepyruvate ferredoxin oxidoreductase beta subunit